MTRLQSTSIGALGTHAAAILVVFAGVTGCAQSHPRTMEDRDRPSPPMDGGRTPSPSRLDAGIVPVDASGGRLCGVDSGRPLETSSIGVEGAELTITVLGEAIGTRTESVDGERADRTLSFCCLRGPDCLPTVDRIAIASVADPASVRIDLEVLVQGGWDHAGLRPGSETRFVRGTRNPDTLMVWISVCLQLDDGPQCRTADMVTIRVSRDAAGHVRWDYSAELGEGGSASGSLTYTDE